LPDRPGEVLRAALEFAEGERAEAETDDCHHHGCESKGRRRKNYDGDHLSAALAHRGKRSC